MSAKSKYTNSILDGKWKFVGYTRIGTIKFQNIFNNKTVLLSNRQVERIMKGVDSVSKIQSRRINSKTYGITNYTAKTYRDIKHKYASKGEQKW